MRAIPLDVIGGFLGAGKTTAINRLLSGTARRIGVIVNDFGAVNIDAALIRSQGADIVALTNGCACCALGDDLGGAIESLRRTAPELDQILVECSGVSDPYRIAQIARLEPGLAPGCVIVLVDAQNFPAQLADRWLTDTLHRQLARADLVALSRGDIATPAERTATRACIAAIAPRAGVLDLEGGLLPDFVFTAGAHVGAPSSRLAAEAAPAHGFRSWHWTGSRRITRPRLEAWLDALPPAVLRVKGLVLLADQEQRQLLQKVGPRHTLQPFPGAGDSSDIVLIGTLAMPSPEILARSLETMPWQPELAGATR